MLNLFTIQGRLTKDPELKTIKNKETKEKRKVASFSIANNKKVGGEEITTFVNCSCWDKLAENLCEFKKKGDLVIVSGELRQREYENDDDETVRVYELIARSIEFDCGQPKKEEKPSKKKKPSKAQDEEDDDSDEEVEDEEAEF